jgi:phosphohistidine phosphatase
MDLLIVRHAIAFERNARRWRDDRRRPLTPQGIQKFKKAAKGLKRLVVAPQQVLTSPYVRARQTADLLTDVAKWPRASNCAALGHGGSPDDVILELRKLASRRVALVGHEPDLSRLISYCIAKADARVAIELKKGGAACLVFASKPRVGGAQLQWLATPRSLRALRRSTSGSPP